MRNAAVLGYLGVPESPAVGLELGQRPFLVSAHEAAIASDISRQDGCEPAFYALGQREPPLTNASIPPLGWPGLRRLSPAQRAGRIHQVALPPGSSS